jgi:hypothetical protein
VWDRSQGFNGGMWDEECIGKREKSRVSRTERETWCFLFLGVFERVDHGRMGNPCLTWCSLVERLYSRELAAFLFYRS